MPAAETGCLDEVQWLWACDEETEKQVKKEMDKIAAGREKLGAKLPLLKAVEATMLVNVDVKPIIGVIEDWVNQRGVVWNNLIWM